MNSLERPVAGKRVLLVEDEALVAAMVEEMLEQLGASVVGPAETLAQGLQLARTDKFDAAVLDRNIRGESAEVIAAVLRDRHIPIVFASGYAARSDMGGNEVCIEKPFTQQKLEAALTAALTADSV